MKDLIIELKKNPPPTTPWLEEDESPSIHTLVRTVSRTGQRDRCYEVSTVTLGFDPVVPS